MATPVSWSFLFEELRQYVVSELGLPDDSALRTILAAQVALLPSVDRVLPERHRFEHDVVAWHQAMLVAKGEDPGGNWPSAVPRLSEFGPGELVVDDPRGVVQNSLGIPINAGSAGFHWEYDTPLVRWA